MFGINRDSHCNQLYANGNKKPSYVDLTKQFITQACARISLVKGSGIHSTTTIIKRFRPGRKKISLIVVLASVKVLKLSHLNLSPENLNKVQDL
uniref:hypothetical protein n=1 Tax=Okeania sp. SIO2F4 TaxID=2607790 RepID=UPI0025F15891|nr:hypothetical protein [Okeania sp. SIO2F4]